MGVDQCIHISNIFYLLSYLCRDILWLRILTCMGLIFGIIFFCYQSENMWIAATWMGVFLAVNTVQITRLLYERKRTRLSRRQEKVSVMMLEKMNRQELLNVLTKSMCENRTDPKLLTTAGTLELDRDQRVVRDLAFDRLSNGELVNLVVRRFWRALRRRKLSKLWRPLSRATD